MSAILWKCPRCQARYDKTNVEAAQALGCRQCGYTPALPRCNDAVIFAQNPWHTEDCPARRNFREPCTCPLKGRPPEDA